MRFATSILSKCKHLVIQVVIVSGDYPGFDAGYRLTSLKAETTDVTERSHGLPGPERAMGVRGVFDQGDVRSFDDLAECVHIRRISVNVGHDDGTGSVCDSVLHVVWVGTKGMGIRLAEDGCGTAMEYRCDAGVPGNRWHDDLFADSGSSCEDRGVQCGGPVAGCDGVFGTHECLEFILKPIDLAVGIAQIVQYGIDEFLFERCYGLPRISHVGSYGLRTTIKGEFGICHSYLLEGVMILEMRWFVPIQVDRNPPLGLQNHRFAKWDNAIELSRQNPDEVCGLTV